MTVVTTIHEPSALCLFYGDKEIFRFVAFKIGLNKALRACCYVHKNSLILAEKF